MEVKVLATEKVDFKELTKAFEPQPITIVMDDGTKIKGLLHPGGMFEEQTEDV